MKLAGHCNLHSTVRWPSSTSLSPTQRHTLHLSILLPSVQHCFKPGSTVRLPNSMVSYFSVPSGPSLQWMGEWEERYYLRQVRGTWAHRSWHFTLLEEWKEAILKRCYVCQVHAYRWDRNKYTSLVKEAGHAASKVHELLDGSTSSRHLQIQRQAFFLHFQKLSTLSLRVEGIFQEQQTLSARCRSISHSLTWAGQPPAENLCL